MSHKLQVLGYSGVAQRDTDEPKHARIFGIDCIRQRLERQHVTRLTELAQRRGATKGAGEAHGRGRHLLGECARRPRALKSGRAQDDEGFELPSLVCAYAAAKG